MHCVTDRDDGMATRTETNGRPIGHIVKGHGMLRLTVLYNLPPGSDEDAFVRWRLTDHQGANAAIPGVVRTDFARINEAWPSDEPPPYRFMTILEWADRASFERGFYDPSVQTDLRDNLSKIADPMFLISEILTETSTGGT